MVDLFNTLAEKLAENHTPEEIARLREAFNYANAAHGGQKRKSGEPFIIHPLETTRILADMRLDVATLQAGLLHDAVEDADTVSLSDVEERFGGEVAYLVDGVTKLGHIDFENANEAQSESMRKMLIAMARDIRVVLIKLADRLHNMRTLSALKPDRQQYKARETMEIFAPLAHRLGISQIKWELEDLAFSYLYPDKYNQVSQMVKESRDERDEYAKAVMAEIEVTLDEVGIKADIQGRPKHLYSIYQKMVNKGKDFSEIYDLTALRILVDNIRDVYAALGTVHNIYIPMPGRFKDYIAMPKFNMYQSLHTTVIGPSGSPLEIQIRTHEMHRMAEFGVAAHWRYKEGTATESSLDQRLAWVRQMMEWQTELDDPGEFMDALRVDLFQEEVFVFTPKGDVKSLKSGATSLDFAFAIHTEVGLHCVGAKVNGSIEPLNYQLQNGDRIDVLTNKNAKPSRDWLGVVKTSSARSKIRSALGKITRDDDVMHGRDELVKVMRKHGVSLSASRVEKTLDGVAAEMNYPQSEDIYAAIGANKISAKLIGTRLVKAMARDGLIEIETPIAEEPLSHDVAMALPKKQIRKRAEGAVVVKGLDRVLVRLAKCCNPVPGDEIIGFVTRGRGVSVHRGNCPNAQELRQSAERLIDVSWDSETAAIYHVEVFVRAMDRLRLLQDVTMKIAESGVNIITSSSFAHKDGIVDMRFLFEIGDMTRLDVLAADLRGVKGVFEARRMLPGEATKKGTKGH